MTTLKRAALTPAAEQALRERKAREAAALRENLRRRKQQARARTDDRQADPEPPRD